MKIFNYIILLIFKFLAIIKFNYLFFNILFNNFISLNYYLLMKIMFGEVICKFYNMSYWLIKTEPDAFSWEKFVSQGRSVWDGVRNFQARNNLKAMQMGDLALFYHSNQGKEIVGIAKVVKEHYPDPTIPEDPRWVVVEFEPVQALDIPVTLVQLKADERFASLALFKQSRLSVVPINGDEFGAIVDLGTKK